MGSRYYDPALGRFLQPDTMIPNPGNPLDWDRYAYARSNPINYVDPSGHWPEWVDYLMGAGCQYADDMSLGLFSYVSGNLDNNQNAAFQNGRQAGRIASTAVATVDEVEGAALAGAAAAGILPTAGGSLAAAPVTGGGSVIVGGVAVAGEVVVAAAGTATAIYGGAVIARIKGNPLSGDGGLNPINDLFEDPWQLDGKGPGDISDVTNWAEQNGWKVETLGRGSHQGDGFILRQYGSNGKPTGRMIQWHPGGGHHGPDPYWKLSDPLKGTIRIGPQFPRPQ